MVLKCNLGSSLEKLEEDYNLPPSVIKPKTKSRNSLTKLTISTTTKLTKSPPILPKEEATSLNNFQTQLDELTTLLKSFTVSQQAENQKLTNLIKEESERTAKKFQTMETCLTNARVHSIHAENNIEYKSIREELPAKIDQPDLSKFKGAEILLIHIRAYKGQMSIKGINKELWPIQFPHL